MFIQTARPPHLSTFFFFNDTATTEIYTLSLHDALPISLRHRGRRRAGSPAQQPIHRASDILFPCLPDNASHQFAPLIEKDRKSTRLNSSHSQISYAVFCLKKKKTETVQAHTVQYILDLS